MIVIATMLLVAWGALSFGAVYPWAFIPLFAGAALAGCAALVWRAAPAKPNLALAAALAFVAAAVAIQLIPLPIAVLQAISPAAHDFLTAYQFGYPTSMDTHPLSIAPDRTRLGLAALAALGLLLVGLARALTRHDALQIVRLITMLGVVMSLIGIVQAALWNGKIYGFWTPIDSSQSFGPFVNRNHFAGWMLMAMPLAIGYFAARTARGMRAVKPGWRHRVLWLASPEAGETVHAGFAVLVMAIALTLSLSRSGLIGLLAAGVIAAWFVVQRQTSAPRRLVVSAYLALLLIVTLGWTGADRLMNRFDDDDLATFGNRAGVWGDTVEIIKDFPIAGTGLNTFGVATILYQTVEPHKHYAEAHSDYLQLAAEGGALVTVPALALIIVIVLTITRRFREVPSESTDYWIRVGAVTGLVAIGLQEVVDFSLQMPGNAVLCVVLLAIALRPVPRRTLL